ncbi:MAG: hypothetical protein Q8M01_04600 [Rubrivivax sp.]|nr:hypothetical protein [Rubrivivax sp.]
MKTSTYLSILGILGIAFGIAFLVAASTMLPMYGLPTEPSNLLQMRYFGATLASFGVFAWLLRNTNDVSAQRGALLAGAVVNALGVAVSLWGLFDKVLGPLGWSSVVIYAVLLLGSLYCLAAAKASAP